MTSFRDGPAAGQVIALRNRAPILLRVTECRGKWDALNELEDEARPREKLYVYRLAMPATWMHICCRPRSQGGFFMVAEYHLLPEQPDDATLRDNAAWRSWCMANKDRLMPQWVKEGRQECPPHK